MHIHRAPQILAILSCFTTLTIMEVTLTAAENDHASSRVSHYYSRETLLTLRQKNSDIKRSGIVWCNKTAIEGTIINEPASNPQATHKRTRRGTKGYGYTIPG